MAENNKIRGGKNEKIIVTTCLLATGFLLTACGESQSSNESQQTTIQFMHSSVEQERLSVINELVADFEKENPDIKIKQVPVEESAFNTKIVTLARSGKLPEVMEVSQDFAKVMDKDELIDQTAVQNVIEEAGEDNYYDGAKTLFVQKMEKAILLHQLAAGFKVFGMTKKNYQKLVFRTRKLG